MPELGQNVKRILKPCKSLYCNDLVGLPRQVVNGRAAKAVPSTV